MSTVYRVKKSVDVGQLIDFLGARRGVCPAAPIYLQADAPEGAKQANWLPAPRGPFTAILRIYGPSEEVQEGKWELPKVQPVD